MRAEGAGSVRAALVVLALMCVAVAAPASLAAPATVHVQEGLGGDWLAEDVVAMGNLSARPGASADLTALMADENLTDWFFAVNYTALRSADNDTLALYFFTPDASALPVDPRGLAVTLPPGGALAFVLYIRMGGTGPDDSAVTYYDGAVWKNRTLQELGVSAGWNDTEGLLEVGCPRDSLLFLEAGQLAAVLFDANGTAMDAVPDLVGQPARVSAAAPFFDYSYHPPIAFSAIGFSDPGAAEGQPVLIFVQLSNEGPKTATGVSAHVLVDGEPLGAREGLTLLPGGTAVMNFTWTAQAGPHNFTATAFPGGNQRSISAVFSGAAAALSIEDVTLDPPTVYVGKDFQVRVTVRNLGAAPSGAAEILLKNATQIIGRASIPQLPAGGATNATLGANFDAVGTRTLRVEIDGVNTPGATRELQVPVTVAPPPFGIPLEVLAALVVVGFGVGMWFLTPRLLGDRRKKS